MEIVKISDLLVRKKESLILEDEIKYKRVTIKSKNAGIVLRDVKYGKDIGTKKQFIIHEGQFLMSKIDARNGAFGIVNKELDNSIITGNFWAFEVNQEKLNIEWFNIFVSSSKFILICDKASSGTTNRRYLDEKKFLNYEINLPSLTDQDLFVKRYKKLKINIDLVNDEINEQKKYINYLRNTILQKALRGKLVEQNPNDEPASILLERIKEEKERLITEKKIKKEKALPEITEEEKAFELPKGWSWTRMNNIIDVRDGTHDSPKYVLSGGYPLITGKDFYGGSLNFTKTKYISKEDYEKIISRSKVDKGDILYSMIGGNIGSMVIIDDELEIAIKNVALFKKYIDGIYETKYLMIYLKATVDDMKSRARGGAQPFVSLTILRNYIIPLPPLEEQKRIVEKVDSLMILCDELEKKMNEQKEYSNKLMESIIKSSLS